MSIQAVAWVLEHECSTEGNERLVLIALANHVGEEWDCWPSVATVAREANVSERTAQRCIARLCELGLVVKHPNAAPDVGQRKRRNDRRPNLYYLVRDGVTRMTPRADDGVTTEAERGDTGRANGVTSVSPESSIEPSSEPSIENPAPSAALEAAKPPDVATTILRAWWEATNPRPAQPYVACLGVVRKMLMAGWAPQDVAWALAQAPVVSTGALTFALNQRGRTKGKGGGAALQRAIDAMEGMTEAEQLEWWNTVGPGRLTNG